MTEIKSKKVDLEKSNKTVFEFLSDLNNFARLLPSEKIENVATTTDTCHFDIKGMAHIGLKITEKIPFQKIHLIADGKTPFDFQLDIFIEEQPNGSAAQLIFNAEINAFMKMIVEKPLTNFFNMLADKLTEIDF